MVLMEYYHELIPNYFISAVGEFQNEYLEFNFGFQIFGPFRKLTRHHRAAPSAKIFVYMTYRKFVYIWYSFQVFGLSRKITQNHADALKHSRRQHYRHNYSWIRQYFCKRSLMD